MAGVLAAGGTGCSSGPERDAAAFCEAYVSVADTGADLADPDEVSLATLRNQVAAIDDAAAEAARVAPTEIADAVEALVEPLDQMRTALEDATTRAEAGEALSDYGAATRAVADDQARLDDWVAANCGVVPVTSTTTPVTLHPPTTG